MLIGIVYKQMADTDEYKYNLQFQGRLQEDVRASWLCNYEQSKNDLRQIKMIIFDNCIDFSWYAAIDKAFKPISYYTDRI